MDEVPLCQKYVPSNSAFVAAEPPDIRNPLAGSVASFQSLRTGTLAQGNSRTTCPHEKLRMVARPSKRTTVHECPSHTVSANGTETASQFCRILLHSIMNKTQQSRVASKSPSGPLPAPLPTSSGGASQPGTDRASPPPGQVVYLASSSASSSFLGGEG